MDINISFPGGKKVYAEVGDMVIKTDQPKLYGGEGTAPSPYLMFLSTIGTCAGIFVLSFCQERGIPTEGVSLVQRMGYVENEDKKSVLDTITIEVVVPPSFPEKYLKAIIKVVDGCAVKKTIMNPPKFEIKTTVSQGGQ